MINECLACTGAEEEEEVVVVESFKLSVSQFVRISSFTYLFSFVDTVRSVTESNPQESVSIGTIGSSIPSKFFEFLNVHIVL